jgi:hypothetical protein
MAIGGLVNPSFEDGLASWTARTIAYDEDLEVRTLVYDGPQGAPDCQANPDPTRICLIEGADEFTVDDGDGTRAVTVTPNDGSKMARLGGPFLSSGEAQQPGLMQELAQTFVVDPANPVLQLNFNVFTWDYSGFDDLEFLVTLTDGDGARITEFHQGSFGPAHDTTLKTTGWQPAYVDLSGYGGEQVRLRISAGGTSDDLYGFWAYIDSGLVEDPPVGEPTITPPNLPGTGTPAPVYPQSTGFDGQVEYWIPNTGGVFAFGPGSDQGTDFANCMDLPISVPIDPGAGTLSQVKLLLAGESGPREFAMTGPTGVDIWSTTIHCVETADLFVSYRVTEGADSEDFIVPIGGLTLVDPSGVVYDKAIYDQQVAGGASAASARAQAAIAGASVRLQRLVAGAFKNVLSGDPGISPNVNPETTAADGRYAWDTNAGTYRVVVKKAGYLDAVSPAVTVPPEVTDLHVALVEPGSATPPTPSPTKPKPPVAVTPPASTPAKKPCAGLKGKARARCQVDERVVKQCGKLGGKKKKVCGQRVRAIAKCQAMKAKTKKQKAKKSACLKRAKQIGKAKKGGKK